MPVLILNGSPRREGTVATLLRQVKDGVEERHETEWVDVYDLDMKHCVGCMKCRPDGECVLPEDDAHEMGRRMREADGLVVGTPTYWSNMSSPLKTLFDRNVTAFMGENERGMPVPRHKGKPAAVVTACSAPWPFNVILGHSTGAVRSVRAVLGGGGYRFLGAVARPGSRSKPELEAGLLQKCRRLGEGF
ncbi:MAG: flavodoxin family protein [Candidatus Eisenbacteria bacterium]|nr:flavodoxin family protein [Candidatus Eisenbacteria bacterium]